MKTYEKRLRQSKKEFEQQSFNSGQQHGREWAEQSADYIDLEKLARGELPAEADLFDVAEFLDCDIEHLTGDCEPEFVHPAKFAQGFVTGALVVFAEVFNEVLQEALA